MKMASFLIFLMLFAIGCGEDIDSGPAPKVLSVSVQDGASIPSNTIISITFSKDMDTKSVVISLNGAPIPIASDDGVTFTFSSLVEDEFELSITGKDTFGQSLEPYNPIRFGVFLPDTTPPTIVDDECEPKNGALYINWDLYRIIIVFSEPMAEVNIVAEEPSYLSKLMTDAKIEHEGNQMTIILPFALDLVPGMEFKFRIC